MATSLTGASNADGVRKFIFLTSILLHCVLSMLRPSGTINTVPSTGLWQDGDTHCW